MTILVRSLAVLTNNAGIILIVFVGTSLVLVGLSRAKQQPASRTLAESGECFASAMQQVHPGV